MMMYGLTNPKFIYFKIWRKFHFISRWRRHSLHNGGYSQYKLLSFCIHCLCLVINDNKRTCLTWLFHLQN